ncbi:hypothetical protein CS562_07470 [Paenibacillus sp. LK1]|nr:hypothetical protein CS562_07470 [Paenibacillus sp. LK1]
MFDLEFREEELTLNMHLKSENIIPIMTSNTSPAGVASASGNFSEREPYRAFNRSDQTTTDHWLVQQVKGWLSYEFSEPMIIQKYSLEIYKGYESRAPRSWTFEGLSDNGVWIILDTISSQTGWNANIKREFSFLNSNYYKRYRINITQNNGDTGYVGIHNMEMFGMVYDHRYFVYNNLKFKSYNGSEFIVIAILGGNPTEKEYLENGMDDISVIPESAWAQLQGEVEFCYYNDDPTKTEMSFNIETKPFTLAEEWEDKEIEVLYYTDDPTARESVVTIETDPFTLAEEWEDKEIKIIEYTDNPNQTESTITIETEPFTLYDELGDSVDVLYYTDDPSKTSSELNITANYSPLDELEGDFDVVTWTNDEDVIAGNSDMMLTYNALPFEQLIVQPSDIALYGDIKKLLLRK